MMTLSRQHFNLLFHFDEIFCVWRKSLFLDKYLMCLWCGLKRAIYLSISVNKSLWLNDYQSIRWTIRWIVFCIQLQCSSYISQWMFQCVFVFSLLSSLFFIEQFVKLLRYQILLGWVSETNRNTYLLCSFFSLRELRVRSLRSFQSR